jgi:hypothetical protein
MLRRPHVGCGTGHPVQRVISLRGDDFPYWRESSTERRTEPSCRYTPLEVLYWVVASPIPESRAVESAVDAVRVLSLRLAIPFPISLVHARDIIPGVRQHMRTSFLADFEGNDAVRFEDFFCRLVAVVSFPLIRCFRVPEQFVIIRSADSRADRFDGVNSPILRGGLYILVCLSAPLSSVTLFSTNPAPASFPPRENSGAFHR